MPDIDPIIGLIVAGVIAVLVALYLGVDWEDVRKNSNWGNPWDWW